MVRTGDSPATARLCAHREPAQPPAKASRPMRAKSNISKRTHFAGGRQPPTRTGRHYNLLARKDLRSGVSSHRLTGGRGAAEKRTHSRPIGPPSGNADTARRSRNPRSSPPATFAYPTLLPHRPSRLRLLAGLTRSAGPAGAAGAPGLLTRGLDSCSARQAEHASRWRSMVSRDSASSSPSSSSPKRDFASWHVMIVQLGRGRAVCVPLVYSV